MAAFSAGDVTPNGGNPRENKNRRLHKFLLY
jgi:hypothetical protein